MGAGLCCAQWWGMASAPDIRRFLGKLILVTFMVMHAPVSGVMTVAQAAGPGGLGTTLVICVDGSFKIVEAPATPHPAGTAAHDCLCPCATMGAKSVLAAAAGGAAVVFLDREIGLADLPRHSGRVQTQPPQSGRGSPRSPPFPLI